MIEPNGPWEPQIGEDEPFSIFDGATGEPELEKPPKRYSNPQAFSRALSNAHPDPSFTRALRDPGRVLSGEELEKRKRDFDNQVTAINERRHAIKAQELELADRIYEMCSRFLGYGTPPMKGENFFTVDSVYLHNAYVGTFQIIVKKLED